MGVLSEFSHGLVRAQSWFSEQPGFSDGSVKIPSRFNQVSVRAQWGSVRVQSWFCQGSIMVQ